VGVVDRSQIGGCSLSTAGCSPLQARRSPIEAIADGELNHTRGSNRRPRRSLLLLRYKASSKTKRQMRRTPPTSRRPSHIGDRIEKAPPRASSPGSSTRSRPRIRPYRVQTTDRQHGPCPDPGRTAVHHRVSCGTTCSSASSTGVRSMAFDGAAELGKILGQDAEFLSLASSRWSEIPCSWTRSRHGRTPSGLLACKAEGTR